jgi:hypothetical protein
MAPSLLVARVSLLVARAQRGSAPLARRDRDG